ncbi:hypothetical protein N5J43_07155 [Pseudomonas nicosulfuronedens]|uniref:hypothetical protein n=1 Tax=Pseudomonas nicosulfuronedens TaxID=2571105 RepID=UPI00244B15BF|nr:hypothetical protein [Pseudomonas nicosulfuronedens]MDH1009329.1 hypothetical protein [Pseudomonas nicosulfuronedens]MDH1978721.1 hypothetical protein [Pseudomonas nicosulfuronedens]MDH2026417.1 hypothetical protein [Pseudomonas nicosulfuronedens]
MERYHDTQTDPLPIRSPFHEAERQRLEQLTAEFLAKGGEVQEVGHQMRDKYTFVLNPSRSPVYAHLFEQPAVPLVAKPTRLPEKEPTARAEPERKKAPALLDARTLAARLMVQAALDASPGQAAKAVGIGEKHARQLIRDFNIKFHRQR